MTSYWNSDELLNQPFVSNLMTKNRFLALSQNFHINDNTTNPPRDAPNHDPLARVRPMLDMIKTTFPANYSPTQNLWVDEAMIKFKGRCPFLQYLPAKPTKWGIKALSICDSEDILHAELQHLHGEVQ